LTGVWSLPRANARAEVVGEAGHRIAGGDLAFSLGCARFSRRARRPAVSFVECLEEIGVAAIMAEVSDQCDIVERRWGRLGRSSIVHAISAPATTR
jgi:hypothetical protein